MKVNQKTIDEAFMAEALREAERAICHGDIPIGVVVVMRNRIIGRGHNERELQQDPTAHAEMLALQAASRAVGSWKLLNATMYSTLEPCPMCAGALVQARVRRLVYGADDPKTGAAGSILDLVRAPYLNHRLIVTGGILADQSRALLAQFFKNLRASC